MRKQNDVEFFNPVKILSGNGALANISAELQDRAVNRPFVVAANVSTKAVRNLLSALAGASLTVTVFSKAKVCANEETAELLVKQFREANCDALISLGGAESMHLTKALSLMLALNIDSLTTFSNTSSVFPKRAVALFYAATDLCDVYESSSVLCLEAMIFEDLSLCPDIVVIDPLLLKHSNLEAFKAPCILAWELLSVLSGQAQENPFMQCYIQAAKSLLLHAAPSLDKRTNDLILPLVNALVYTGIALANYPGEKAAILSQKTEDAKTQDFESFLQTLQSVEEKGELE